MQWEEYQSMRSNEKALFTQNLIDKQDNKCALCIEPLVYQRRLAETMPVVDHDHKTGEIRGILHSKCNTDLAVIENRGPGWISKAYKYLGIIDVFSPV